jgi:hypothetical protein
MPTDMPPIKPLKKFKRTDTLLDHLHRLAMTVDAFDASVRHAKSTNTKMPPADDILWAAVHLGRLLIREDLFRVNP